MSRLPTMADARRRDLIRNLGRDGWNARAVDRETILASRSDRMPRLIRLSTGRAPVDGIHGLDVFAASARKVGALPQVGWWPPGRGVAQFVDQKDFPR